ncbi:MAG: Crp/Fnr family transcriptional regulator, partial [Actinomycetota bacterium]
MPARNEAIDESVVRKAPIFQGLDDAAANTLRASMSPVKLRKGQSLFKEGDDGDHLYIVTTGKIKLGTKSQDGRENLLMILGPGEMFGDLSLFDAGPRTATATAVTESRLLVLGQDKVIPWVKEHPEVSLHLLARLASRLRRTNEVVGDLVFSDVPGRVAKALIDLGLKFGVKKDEGFLVNHDLTQE